MSINNLINKSCNEVNWANIHVNNLDVCGDLNGNPIDNLAYSISNIGTGEVILAPPIGNYQLKSLIAGPNISLTPSSNSITIEASGGSSGISSVNNSTVGTGTFYTLVQNPGSGPAISIKQLTVGTNLNLVDNGSNLSLTYTGTNNKDSFCRAINTPINYSGSTTAVNFYTGVVTVPQYNNNFNSSFNISSSTNTVINTSGAYQIIFAMNNIQITNNVTDYFTINITIDTLVIFSQNIYCNSDNNAYKNVYFCSNIFVSSGQIININILSGSTVTFTFSTGSLPQLNGYLCMQQL